jgi:hypothetical protein
MCLGGFHTDIESHGDFFAALSFGEKLHDFSLPAGQAIANSAVLPGTGFAIAKAVQHHFGNFGGEKRAMHGQSFDGVYKVAIGIGFKNVSSHPGLHYFVHQFVGQVEAQYYDFRIWEALANLSRRFKPVELRHPDIHYHNVGLPLQSHNHCFATGLGFTAHVPAFAFQQELAQTGPDDVMVVRNQYPHKSNSLKEV